MHGKDDPRAGFFAALAARSRLAVVEFLAAGERCVCEIVPHLDLDPSVVSRHLAQLERAGILISRRAGVKVFYQLASPRVLRALRVAALIAEAKARTARRELRRAAGDRKSVV